MVAINLLPWREYARQRQKKIRIVAGVVGMCVLVTMLVWVGFFSKSTISAPPARLYPAPSALPKIKFIGYLHQQDRTWGLLLLPNNMTQAVQVGSVIAALKVRVVSITEQEMGVVFANGEKQILKI